MDGRNITAFPSDVVRALQCGADVFRFIHLLTVATQRLREQIEGSCVPQTVQV